MFQEAIPGIVAVLGLQHDLRFGPAPGQHAAQHAQLRFAQLARQALALGIPLQQLHECRMPAAPVEPEDQ
ncbi:hypothetical protein [Massilia sp. BSC265]|uniref:hypothetical protein n=1 Tax=Massilia sp. BSC265 TaxID=1549812 RepID=UPI00190F931E|nr:hypothetical protein [Massilia sp. BSC265]